MASTFSLHLRLSWAWSITYSKLYPVAPSNSFFAILAQVSRSFNSPPSLHLNVYRFLGKMIVPSPHDWSSATSFFLLHSLKNNSCHVKFVAINSFHAFQAELSGPLGSERVREPLFPPTPSLSARFYRRIKLIPDKTFTLKITSSANLKLELGDLLKSRSTNRLAKEVLLSLSILDYIARCPAARPMARQN